MERSMQLTLEGLLEFAEDSVSFPHSAYEIMRVAGSPDSTAAELAKLIEQDPAFTARLLRLVNSPAFNPVREIASIRDAITLAGRKEISEMAWLLSSAKAFDPLESRLMRATTFWSHSRASAFIASELAALVDVPPEDVFVGALLHDIGLLLFLRAAPDLMTTAMDVSLEQGTTLVAQEKKLFGFDHAELGGELARSWRLPERLVHVIRYHHTPNEATENRAAVMCVAVANELAGDFEVADESTLAAVDQFVDVAGCEPSAVEALIPKSQERLQRYAAMG